MVSTVVYCIPSEDTLMTEYNSTGNYISPLDGAKRMEGHSSESDGIVRRLHLY